MHRLPESEIEKIISLLKEGKTLPEDYRQNLIQQLEQLKKSLLFDTKKEYELLYADKEREVDILADTMAVPLQKVKTFRNGADGNDWTNMLIFGDNLQVLKTLLQMKEEGKLTNADGTPGVRLVYIDPPFATRQEFRGSQDQKAYQDKIAGAEFLEFLRKRLVFLRELCGHACLTPDSGELSTATPSTCHTGSGGDTIDSASTASSGEVLRSCLVARSGRWQRGA